MTALVIVLAIVGGLGWLLLLYSILTAASIEPPTPKEDDHCAQRPSP